MRAAFASYNSLILVLVCSIISFFVATLAFASPPDPNKEARFSRKKDPLKHTKKVYPG